MKLQFYVELAQWIKDVCPITLFILAQIWRSHKKKISATCWFSTRYADFGGERGIRTPGTSRYGSFQDYCNRPLYHLSNVDRRLLFLIVVGLITIKRMQRYCFFFIKTSFLRFLFLIARGSFAKMAWFFHFVAMIVHCASKMLDVPTLHFSLECLGVLQNLFLILHLLVDSIVLKRLQQS